MAKFLFIFSCLLSLHFQANSQIIRTPNFLNPRPYADTIIELPRNVIEVPRNFDFPRNFIDVSRIIETPRNVLQQPMISGPPMMPIPPTTAVTDCTPSVCKNLADTINIMVVSNLLQNTLGELKNLKMAATSLKSVLTNPALANCPGLISNLVNPNLVVPNLGAPKVIATSPVAPPNSVAPNIPISNTAMLSYLLKMLGNPV